MIQDRDILQAFGDRMTGELRARIPTATGRTRDGVRLEVTESRIRIYAPLHLKAVIDGRGPATGDGQADEPLYKRILEWMDVLGIEGKLYERKDGSLQDQLKADIGMAVAIAKSINKKGTKGRPGLLDGWIKESELSELASRVGQNRRREYLSDVLKAVA